MDFCVTDWSIFLRNTQTHQKYTGTEKTNYMEHQVRLIRWTSSVLVSSREEAWSTCSPSQDMDGGVALKLCRHIILKKPPKKYLWSLNNARCNSEELLKIEILDLNALLDLNLTSGSYIKQLHEVTKVTPGRNSAISDMIFAMQFTPFLGSKYYSITVFKTILNPCIIKTLYIDLLSRRSIFKKLNS